jgi:hypothetical protein
VRPVCGRGRRTRVAADLWIDLDGHPLAELGRPDVSGVPDIEVDVAVVELVRRLKALGLIEDLP